jgi:outer membrane biosynthesis protein TonB
VENYGTMKKILVFLAVTVLLSFAEGGFTGLAATVQGTAAEYQKPKPPPTPPLPSEAKKPKTPKKPKKPKAKKPPKPVLPPKPPLP